MWGLAFLFSVLRPLPEDGADLIALAPSRAFAHGRRRTFFLVAAATARDRPAVFRRIMSELIDHMLVAFVIALVSTRARTHTHIQIETPTPVLGSLHLPDYLRGAPLCLGVR